MGRLNREKLQADPARNADLILEELDFHALYDIYANFESSEQWDAAEAQWINQDFPSSANGQEGAICIDVEIVDLLRVIKRVDERHILSVEDLDGLCAGRN